MFVRVLLAVGLLLPGGAQAYTLKQTDSGKPVRWAEMPVRYKVSQAGARDVSRSEARRAVDLAFSAWTKVNGAAVALVNTGETTRPVGFESGGSNENVVAWSRDAWPFEPDALAMTVTAYRQTSGALVDADILINEEDYAWGIGTQAENDLANALTHEVGHFLGLAHSTNSDATMFARAEPFETEKRSLHGDDGAALVRLYPGTPVATPEAKADSGRAPAEAADGAVGTQITAARPSTPKVKINMGCAQSPLSGSGLWGLVLLGLGSRWRAGRRTRLG